jgi:predicted TIM-barrel fold metal-dependent hydrolase
MIDSHVHIRTNSIYKNQFMKKLKKLGGDGAVLFSLPPQSYSSSNKSASNQGRLDNVLEWCEDLDSLYPFFWLDPLESDVQKQVKEACKNNIMGFKVICDRFYPSHPQCMRVLNIIAEYKKPVIFHSGILWDRKVSSKYNRPIEFECLLKIPKLKFALAHASWPWCDEVIALYGKFLHTSGTDPENSPEMFIDTTPGTPVIYRNEVLTKLYMSGYDIENNTIWGLDSRADNYNSEWAEEWFERDCKILKDLSLNDTQIEKYFSSNIKSFLGLKTKAIKKKTPTVGSNY